MPNDNLAHQMIVINLHKLQIQKVVKKIRRQVLETVTSQLESNNIAAAPPTMVSFYSMNFFHKPFQAIPTIDRQSLH